jgi:hypothetical protein
VIFAVRAVLVCLGFFGVVYSLLSLLILFGWRTVARSVVSRFVGAANFLFGLRIFSFVVSVVVTLCFTFPSFWLLERAAPDEDLATFVLAVCALIILTAGLFRVLKVQARTTRAVAQWLGETNPGNAADMTVLSPSDAPALILVGIRRPRVMISHVAADVLSNEELQVAVRHELAHRHSWDNLKKVVISAIPFPGMGSIENAWREAAELVADDAAVTNRQEALVLAASLIKLSRSCQQSPKPLLVTGLVSKSSSISLRIERLVHWRRTSRRFRHPWQLALLLTLAMLVGVASNYTPILMLTHRLTEIFVP